MYDSEHTPDHQDPTENRPVQTFAVPHWHLVTTLTDLRSKRIEILEDPARQEDFTAMLDVEHIEDAILTIQRFLINQR